MKLFSVEKIKYCAKALKSAFGLSPRSLSDQAKLDEISACVEAGFNIDAQSKIEDVSVSIGARLNWDHNTAVFWNALAAYNNSNNTAGDGMPRNGFNRLAELLLLNGEDVALDRDFMDKCNDNHSALFIDYVYYIWALAFFGDAEANNANIERKYGRDETFGFYIKNCVKGFKKPSGRVESFSEKQFADFVIDVERKLASWNAAVQKLRRLYAEYGLPDADGRVSVVKMRDDENEFDGILSKIDSDALTALRGADLDFGVALNEGCGKIFYNDVGALFNSYRIEGNRIKSALKKIKMPYAVSLVYNQSFDGFIAQCDKTEEEFRSGDALGGEAYSRRMAELQAVKDNAVRAKRELNLTALMYGNKSVFQPAFIGRCLPESEREINAAPTLIDALDRAVKQQSGKVSKFIDCKFSVRTQAKSHIEREKSTPDCSVFEFEHDHGFPIDGEPSSSFISTVEVTNVGKNAVGLSLYFEPREYGRAIMINVTDPSSGRQLFVGRLCDIDSAEKAVALAKLDSTKSYSVRMTVKLAPQLDSGLTAEEYRKRGDNGFLPVAIVRCAADPRTVLSVPGVFWQDIIACAQSIIDVSRKIKGVEDRIYRTQLLGEQRGFEDVGKRYADKYVALIGELRTVCDNIGPIGVEKLTKPRCDALGIPYAEAAEGVQKIWLQFRDEADGVLDKIRGIVSEIDDAVQSINEFSHCYKFKTLDELERAFDGIGDAALSAEVAELKNKIRNFSVTYDRSGFVELKDDAERLADFVADVIMPGLKQLAEKSEKEKDIVAFDKNNQKFVMQCRLMEEDRAEIDTDMRSDSGKTLEVYDYAYYHELMDAAVNVRKQPVFCDYDDRITSYPYFKPFKYQIDSVRTMLSRFEGRGIYGDQVGLGKTLQTLMTAGVMHKCRAIKHALIIVPPKLVHQWRKECETKFRDEDGECMFEIYPKDARSKYSFDDLLKIFNKDGNTLRGKKQEEDTDKLKIYLVSDGVISAASSRIEKATYADNWLYEYDKLYTELPANIDLFTEDLTEFEQCVAAVHNRSLLNIMEKQLKQKYEAELKENVIPSLRAFMYIDESNLVTPQGELLETSLDKALAQKYNARLKNIFDRKSAVVAEHDKYVEQDIYKQLSVDLLIFDEVDRLIRGADKTGKVKDADGNELDITTVQEFLSRLDKKFCVLASATPIRTDLSDIFNLLYIVDRTKLGDSREIAENRFYNIYCGGSRSLSEMAADKDVENKLQILNGLINSMFTRKRVSDPDVRESMRRQCSTPDEIAEAQSITAAAAEKGVVGYDRDDYGGKKFLRLAHFLTDAYNEIVIGDKGGTDSESVEDRVARWKSKWDKYAFVNDGMTAEFFEDAELLVKDERELPDDQKARLTAKKRAECVIDMVNGIFNAYKVQIEKQKVIFKESAERLANCYKENNPCEMFCRNYDALRANEANGKYDVVLLKNCNLQCSFINRGLLDFARAKHEYSTVFVSEYLDWRRPVKRDVVIPIATRDQKTEIIGDLLIRDNSNNHMSKSMGLTETDVQAVLTSKALVYEKEKSLRAGIYRELCAIALNERHKAKGERDKKTARQTDSRREVYINLDDDQVKEQKYTAAELLDLGYFYRKDPSAENSGFNIYKNIIAKKKKGQKLSLDEQRFIDIYDESGRVIKEVTSDDGTPRVLNPKTFGELNYKWFTRFMIDNGNWNAVYFIDNAQLAGTDLNAANILIISNLDYYPERRGFIYLDPLDMEQLVGRISRTGQTEECVVYSLLYSGLSDCSPETAEFNAIYYDILKDKEGFDLFSACKTEVDFVVPVVMACARQLFSSDSSYLQTEIDRTGADYQKFSVDRTPFIAVYKNADRSVEKFRLPKTELVQKYKRFPDILKFAYEHKDDIYVVRNFIDSDGAYKCETLSPTDAIKYMVRLYAKLLGHERKGEGK